MPFVGVLIVWEIVVNIISLKFYSIFHLIYYSYVKLTNEIEKKFY